MDRKLRQLQRRASLGDPQACTHLMIGAARVARNDLVASICRDSFYEFVKHFWSEIIAEEPVWNWHMEKLCDELQEAAERVFRGEDKLYDLVINIPPGSSKSTICSIMFPAWAWIRMASIRCICTSYAYNLAMDLSRKSRDVVQSDKWIDLFGNINLREDQNTKGYFANTEGGFRFAVGTDGNVTGMHSHFIIIDDPINPNAAFSEAELATANRFVSETLSGRKVNKAVTLTILIMQRLHQNDPSAVMLAKGVQYRETKGESGVPMRHINLPGECIGPPKQVVRPRSWAKFYTKRLLDPDRMSRKVLTMQKAELGEYAYAGQILQSPVPPGGGMFKTPRIAIDEPPPLRHFKGLVRYWDKAGTHDGGAWTVGVLMGRDAKERFWILDVVRGQWESAEREEIILQTTKLDDASAGKRKVITGVEQEPGSGGKESAQATAKNLAGYRVRIERPTGTKEVRADPFSVQVNARNVYMRTGYWNKEYVEELKFFPASTFKDQVDASSGAFNLLTTGGLRPGVF